MYKDLKDAINKTEREEIKENTRDELGKDVYKRQAKKLAAEHHIEYEERHKKGDIINLFFEEYLSLIHIL